MSRPSNRVFAESDPSAHAHRDGRSFKTKLFRFLIVGGSSAVIDLGVSVLALRIFGIPVEAAHTVGFLTGMVYNYTLNRVWSFQTAVDKQVAPLAKYLVVVGLNYLLGLMIVSVTVRLSPVESDLVFEGAKILAIGLGSIFTFFAYDRWVFK